MVCAKGYQTLACALGIIVLLARRLTHNGTAIEGVCVTGEAIRPVVPVVSMVPIAIGMSRWQAGMARYLQSRVRLVLRSRYDEGSYLMFVMFKDLVSCQGKGLQIP
jgi:hypothetical protein